MRTQTLLEFAKLQVVRLQTGDMNGFLDRFEMPLPFYSPAGMSVLPCVDPLRRMIECYAAEMHDHGICEMRPGSITITETSQLRTVAVLTWDHLDIEGRTLSQSIVRYVVRQSPPDAEPKIEMVEYLQLSFPQVMSVLHAVRLN